MKKNSFWTSSSGGIVLESAMIMPFFSSLLFAVMSFILIAICDMGLSSAVSETTKQVASHWYPVDAIAQKAGESEPGKQLTEWLNQIKEWRGKLEATQNWFDTYARFLPEPLLDAIDATLAIPDAWQQQMGEQFQKVLSASFQPLLMSHTDRQVFFKNQGMPRITHVEWPSLKDRQEAYFGIEADYVFVLPIPFVHQEIRLKQRALERLWVGQ